MPGLALCRGSETLTNASQTLSHPREWVLSLLCGFGVAGVVVVRGGIKHLRLRTVFTFGPLFQPVHTPCALDQLKRRVGLTHTGLFSRWSHELTGAHTFADELKGMGSLLDWNAAGRCCTFRGGAFKRSTASKREPWK